MAFAARLGEPEEYGEKLWKEAVHVRDFQKKLSESGGGSLTGPRLHRFQVLRSQDDRRRCVEETQDEGLRLQPGVWRQLLSANDPVHQPQRHLRAVLEEGRRLPAPQR